MKKILITGALGHIGSALIRSLDPALINEIILLDNLESQRYCSLFDLPDNFTYRFIQEDVRTVDFAPILKGVDYVIHLAAITNAEGSAERQKEVEEVNFYGLQRVADACLVAGLKIIFPSTTSVYGSQDVRVDETCQELKPQSPYADSKLASENYLIGLKNKGLKFVICRFGTIFGWSIGMRFHTAVNKFIWQAVNHLPITVWKTAWQQRRPYLDLNDCLNAINFIIKNDIFDGEIYNVLTANYTVKDIVTTIQKFTPDLQVSYVDSRIMNQLSYDVIDDKFKAKGYVPQGYLEKSIGKTIEHLRKIHQ
jgi:UDP-glucose 4-epimerase